MPLQKMYHFEFSLFPVNHVMIQNVYDKGMKAIPEMSKNSGGV